MSHICERPFADECLAVYSAKKSIGSVYIIGPIRKKRRLITLALLLDVKNIWFINKVLSNVVRFSTGSITNDQTTKKIEKIKSIE